MINKYGYILNLAFLFLLLPLSKIEAQSQGHKTKLGMIIPLSGSGALMGESLQRVTKFIPFKHIEPVFEDDGCDGKTAISAYLKLRTQGVNIFYVACSGSILAIAPLAKKNGDLILTTYAGSIRIRESGDEVIRLNPDGISVAEAMIPLITKDLQPTIILHEEQEYASSLAEKFTTILARSVIEKIPYQSDSTSFAAEILRIKAKNPKSIVLIPVGDTAARLILQQLAQNGIKIPVIGEVNLCDYPFKLTDFKLNGKCVAAMLKGSEYDKFISDYTSQSGHAPAYPFYDAMAYDLFSHMDHLAEDNLTVSKIKNELLSGFKGKFATYKFTANGEIKDVSDYLVIREY